MIQMCGGPRHFITGSGGGDMDIFSVITLMGGLTFFLFGMNVMSGSL